MLALQRIAKHDPNVKLILAVRDPMERALSDMYHDVRKGKIDQDVNFLKYLENQYHVSFR